MKYLIFFLIALFNLPAMGQQSDPTSRKLQIEKSMEQIYSVKEFQQIANALQITIDELCDYPIISPIKKPQRISSSFGMRKHPIYKAPKFHSGIDIPQVKGTPVHATGNGTVVRKGYSSGYGYFLEIEHAGGFHSFYAHLSKTVINIGDFVEIAQQIACVGSTGAVTGSHLHYEVRKGKRYLNPRGWCDCLYQMKQTKYMKSE